MAQEFIITDTMYSIMKKDRSRRLTMITVSMVCFFSRSWQESVRVNVWVIV